MIKYGGIYPEQFQKVISVLERWNDREARHLVNDLYKLEQIPDKKEEEEIDKDSLLEAMSTGDLEELKVKYKKHPSVTKLIDGILEARGKPSEYLLHESNYRWYGFRSSQLRLEREPMKCLVVADYTF